MLGVIDRISPEVPVLDTAMRGSQPRQAMVLAFDQCLCLHGPAVCYFTRKILNLDLHLSMQPI